MKLGPAEAEVADAMPRAGVDDIVRRLEQAILRGVFPPGSRLSEQMLCGTYGVGRGPLREAIRTLEGRRLVERTPYSGVKVADPSLEDLMQLLATREALEGMACRQAAENMTLAEVARLRECLSAYGKVIDRSGLSGIFAHDAPEEDFHVQVVRGSRNRWLMEFLCRDLYALLRISRLRSSTVAHRVEQAAEEHAAILVAIERRDPDAAERLMRTHIAHSREALLRGTAG